jgi:hypothetical protein
MNSVTVTVIQEGASFVGTVVDAGKAVVDAISSLF